MSARMGLHVALSLRLDAVEAYRLANAYRAEVLREAAEALRVEHRRIFWATKPDTCAEAEFLDRMADAGPDNTTTAEPEPGCDCLKTGTHRKLTCGHCAMDICEDCKTCAACPHTCDEGGW